MRRIDALVGAAVVENRRQKQITAADLSAASQIELSRITLIEQGSVRPTAAELLSLCRALSVSPSALLQGIANSIDDWTERP